MRSVRGSLVVMALLLVGAACSDGGEDAASSPVPEDVRASAAEVAEGLQAIQTTSDGIAAALAIGDQTAAQALVDQIEPAWQGIEGTLKANDEDAYITFEDTFALLETAVEDGDDQLAQQGADAVSEAVSAYLATYPG